MNKLPRKIDRKDRQTKKMPRFIDVYVCMSCVRKGREIINTVVDLSIQCFKHYNITQRLNKLPNYNYLTLSKFLKVYLFFLT